MDASEAARALAGRRRHRSAICPRCGSAFRALGAKRYCSPACQEAARRDRHREARRELERRRYARKRDELRAARRERYARSKADKSPPA